MLLCFRKVLRTGASVTAVGSNVSYVLPAYEPDFRRFDYGPSDFDRKHVFSLSYVWELPKVGNGWGPAHYILERFSPDFSFAP